MPHQARIQKRIKYILANIFVFSFISIQLAESFLNRNDWPFSSFSMYAEKLSHMNRYIVIVGHFKNGEPETFLPWELLPIDYYKTMGLLKKVYMRGVESGLTRSQLSLLLSKGIERKGLQRIEVVMVEATKKNLRNILILPKKYQIIQTFHINDQPT